MASDSILASIYNDPSQLGGDTDPELKKNHDKYRKRYDEYIKKHGSISTHVYRKIVGGSIPEVYYHFEVRSDGNDEIIYDVVLLLYTNDKGAMQEPSFKKYSVQIFSNSPAFTFRYAYVYNKHHRIPEELLYKYSKITLNNPPTKTNPNQFVGFDSSTFYALTYLIENPMLLYRKGISSIAKDIDDFDMTKIPTPDEVVERRSPKNTSTVKKLEKTLKSIIKKPKNIIFGSGKTKKVTAKGGIKATGAKHAVKASKPKKPR
jgi:hypothetical protein